MPKAAAALPVRRLTTRAQVTILGSGTSTGVPVIACPCAVCASPDPRDKRQRASLLLTLADGANLVVDTGPDFRNQMLAARVTRLTEVIYTHLHADHCHGFDDLRAFFFRWREAVTCHVAAAHTADFRSRFAYALHDTGYEGIKPQIQLESYAAGATLQILGLEVETAMVPHGHIDTAVLRFGRFAYATDFKALPPELIKRWRGRIDTMVASGIRFGEHPTHSCIQETVAMMEDLQIKQGFITHIAHEILHARDETRLPPHIHLAYDGLSFPVDL